MKSRVAASAFALASVARAASAAVAVNGSLSTEQAEVGDGIRVEVSALSDGDDAPSNPRLRVPPGFSVQGPSVSSTQSFSLQNGHFERRHGLTATWIVVATAPGHYSLGPATFSVGSGTAQSQAMSVEIVAKGAMPQRPRRPGGLFGQNDPFDPFGMFQRLPLPGLDDDGPLLDQEPEAPPEYAVDHAADPMAFLRATATPTDVVVGQQVTLRIYAYAGRGPYDEASSSEPSRPDFLSQSIVDTSFKQPRYVVHIDGQPWTVVKEREIALFPLKAGTLTIGPMRLGFQGPRYPETTHGQGLIRFSKPITIVAHEPPLAGRPPGYELGDVGRYTLSAEVEPRRVEAGDAIAVTVRLEGVGNVPHHVKLPQQNGIDFLDPTITEGQTVNGGVIGGHRQFRYVVRLTEPGKRDLGDVTLPYFDPESGRYEVARAALGAVEVLPGAAPVATAPVPGTPPKALERDPFELLGPPRTKLAPLAPPPAHLGDRPWYWALLLGAPLVVLGARGALSLLSGARRRLAERSSSPSTAAKRALDDARAARGRGETAQVAASIERAVYGMVEARLGLKARAVLRGDLAKALESRGATASLAADIAKLLDACDGLRFAGATADGQKLVDDASRLVTAISRTTPKGGAS
ncbi:MAG TPA: BatD family protein [Polyangiaceae bacterium]|nr:BatD family protein [Polyangiaceae bacterium]